MTPSKSDKTIVPAELGGIRWHPYVALSFHWVALVPPTLYVKICTEQYKSVGLKILSLGGWFVTERYKTRRKCVLAIVK